MRRTTSRCFGAALGVLLWLPIPPVIAQDAERTISDETLVRLLDRAGLEPELLEPGLIRYTTDVAKIILKNTKKDALIHVGFNTDGEGELDRVAQWNLVNADGTRAYLDADDDPWIEADIDFEQGLTTDAIRSQILAFNDTVARFLRQIVTTEDDVSAPPPGPDQDVAPGLIAGVLESLDLDYRCATNREAKPGETRRQYNIAHDNEEIILRVDTAGRLLLRDTHVETMDADAVNEWNRGHRFACLMLDEQGRLTLESALVLDPDDLNDAAIRQWFGVFHSVRKSLHKDLIARAKRGAAAREPSPLRVPTEGWTAQQVAGTGFRVAMPGDPEINREPVEGQDGPMPSILLRVKSGAMVFVAGRQDYPAEVANLDDEAFFTQVAEGFVPEGARIVSRNSLEIDGMPGRELTIEAPAVEGESPARSVQARVARDGRLGYFLVVGAPSGQLEQGSVLAFFASFSRVQEAQRAREPEAEADPDPQAEAFAPGEVPFSSMPAPPELYDLSRSEREVPDGWISLRFHQLELKLAFPSRPEEPSQISCATGFGPAIRRQVLLEDEGVRYVAEMWAFPESAGQVEDEALFAELARVSMFAGEHEMVEPAMRLTYGTLPVRDVAYRSVATADGARTRVRLRMFRNGSEGWAFLTVEPAANRRSDDPGNAFFGAIQWLGKPIGASARG